VAEVCDGVDNDCDGSVDETFACVLGSAVSCDTTCGGEAGSGTCTASCGMPTGASCSPPAESCNYVDDNCDGIVDEHVAAPQGAVTVPGASAVHGVRAASGPNHALIAYRAGATLYAQVVDLDGRVSGPAVTVSAHAGDFVDVVQTSATPERFGIAWIETSAGLSQVRARSIDVSAGLPVVATAHTIGGVDDSHGSLSFVNSSLLLLVYTSSGAQGADLVSALLDADFAPLAAPTTVATGLVGSAGLAVASDPRSTRWVLVQEVGSTTNRDIQIMAVDDASIVAIRTLGDAGSNDEAPVIARAGDNYLLAHTRDTDVVGWRFNFTGAGLIFAAEHGTTPASPGLPHVFGLQAANFLTSDRPIALASDGGRWMMLATQSVPGGNNLRLFSYDSNLGPLDEWHDTSGSPATDRVWSTFTGVALTAGAGRALLVDSMFGVATRVRSYGCD